MNSRDGRRDLGSILSWHRREPIVNDFSLCWMPSKWSPSQQVEMQVKHRLPALAVTIQHQTKAPLSDSLLHRDAVRDQEEVPEELIITLLRV